MLDNNRRIKGSKALQAGFNPGISNLASYLFLVQHGQLKKISSITMKGKRLLNQVRLFLAQRSIDRRPVYVLYRTVNFTGIIKMHIMVYPAAHSFSILIF